MNYRQIECFLTLAETGNFLHTAESFGVSQPAISKQISALERDLGLKLFDRNYRKVTLTPAGKILYDSLHVCRNIYNGALIRARRLSRDIKTEIRIGVCEATEINGLAEVLSAFHTSHPTVSVIIERNGITELAKKLDDGECDMIITHQFGMKASEKITCEEIADRKYVGLISKNHRLARKPDLCFSDFRNEKFYVPGASETALSKDYCSYICASQGFVPQKIEVMPNMESVLTAVQIGQGVAVLDDLIAVSPERQLLRISVELPSKFIVARSKYCSKPFIDQLAAAIKADFCKDSSAANDSPV